MIKQKIIKTIVVVLFGASFCLAADDKETGKKATASPGAAPTGLFSTNASGDQIKAAPFSSEISADFIKKVMETSARIEECKKQIAERQAYLFESNRQIKAYRSEMVEMQHKINSILDADKELAGLRLNRDMLWTTMPTLPKGRDQFSGPRRPPVK